MFPRKREFSARGNMKAPCVSCDTFLAFFFLIVLHKLLKVVFLSSDALAFFSVLLLSNWRSSSAVVSLEFSFEWSNQVTNQTRTLVCQQFRAAQERCEICILGRKTKNFWWHRINFNSFRSPKINVHILNRLPASRVAEDVLFSDAVIDDKSSLLHFCSWTGSPESHAATMWHVQIQQWHLTSDCAFTCPLRSGLILSTTKKKKTSWNCVEKILLEPTGWRLSGRLWIPLCLCPYPPPPSHPQTDRTTKGEKQTLLFHA